VIKMDHGQMINKMITLIFSLLFILVSSTPINNRLATSTLLATLASASNNVPFKPIEYHPTSRFLSKKPSLSQFSEMYGHSDKSWLTRSRDIRHIDPFNEVGAGLSDFGLSSYRIGLDRYREDQEVEETHRSIDKREVKRLNARIGRLWEQNRIEHPEFTGSQSRLNHI
jgi:hypothetical protein